MRIGHGYDVHAFGPGDSIILGGVQIPYHQSLIAHSDGDVLLHAICDALLGAAACGDIGRHFPDHDAAFSNIDSRILLHHVRQTIAAGGWQVCNIDSTVIAQAPKLASYIPQMQQHIAADLGLLVDCINVKATTTERLGYIGREEGIAVHAVALLQAT